ncbi:MAG TPA: hypothetical protein VMZ33_08220 [Candidatus Limnocylindrales bacterium]|nr:hypothetical protein [Candidatus Limnocylindrales bacterium]
MGQMDTYAGSARDSGTGPAREFDRRAAESQRLATDGADTHAPATNGAPTNGAPTNGHATHGAAVAQVLRAWRDVERQLAGMADDDPEAVTAKEQIARLRDEYHRRVEEESQQRTNEADGTSRP